MSAALAVFTWPMLTLIVARGYVPPEIFNKYKRELKDLKTRHQEYKHIMLSGDVTHVPIGDKSFAAASVHNANFDISPNRSQVRQLPRLTLLEVLTAQRNRHCLSLPLPLRAPRDRRYYDVDCRRLRDP